MQYHRFSSFLFVGLFGTFVVLSVIPLFAQAPAPTNQPQPAAAQAGQASTKSSAKTPAAPEVVMPEIVAEVDDDRILKSHLAAESLKQFGPEMLKDEIKKQLILLECHKRNIRITQEEIVAEIERLAKIYGRTSEEWLKLFEEERGFAPQDYIDNLIVPRLALTKLAGTTLKVMPEDIQREFDSRFGPAVQVRQIMLRDKTQADKIRAEVAANPDSFSSAAKNISQDPSSAPYGGLLPPMRRHVFDPVIEKVAFALKEGEVSPVFSWQDFFLIFKCEQHFPAQTVDIEIYRAQLEQRVFDANIGRVADELFIQLTKQATIEVVMTDPVKSKQHPGVAAVINGHTITTEQIAERCILRYGRAVLNEMISRLVIERECRRRNLTISEADIDKEIREMAMKFLPLTKEGQPDVRRWLDRATEEAGVSVEQYRVNTVWPMLALKTMARPGVKVTVEDIQKGYWANFGPSVRCLAIFLDSERHAQNVWNKAMQLPTEENFGDLAETYSIDDSRLVRGVIPALRRYCGFPKIEEEAFRLKPGEISAIVRENGVYVVLYCVERNDETATPLEQVQADIQADVYEKKLNMGVAMLFEKLYASAKIYNYLEGKATGPVSAELPDANQPAKR